MFKWVRWHWSDGWGRWHVIASEASGVATTACGRVRKPPADRRDRPSDRLCPTCRTLDDLRRGYKPEDAVEPLSDLVGEKVLVPVGKPKEQQAW